MAIQLIAVLRKNAIAISTCPPSTSFWLIRGLGSASVFRELRLFDYLADRENLAPSSLVRPEHRAQSSKHRRRPAHRQIF